LITVYYAHPYPDRSAANRLLVEAVRDVPGVRVRPLYDLYPDFAIDVAAEQRSLLESDLVVWQHPLYWYSVPALLKLWFEKVLAHGWAYGKDAAALHGKDCLWVTTTGAGEGAYTPAGVHGHPFESFVPVVEQTARFCGMRWHAPIVVQGAHRLDPEAMQARVDEYRARLASYPGWAAAPAEPV
jgi:glutathione-regulated potassium-efflux system ancillary protein KefF